MKLRSPGGFALLTGVLLAGLVAVSGYLPIKVRQASTWQQMTAPGPLSSAHAFLENNCAACHTPGKGAEAVNCVACHANNTALLQRQPTAFHADITACAPCHREHQGGTAPTTMDHAALARIGLSKLKGEKGGPQSRWIEQHMNENQRRTGNPNLSAPEATLNCVTCHAAKDRHQGLFGTACASCHAVTKWTIPEFRHPSPNSRSCAQCHQAPPSHYMMHFSMISQSVAHQSGATVTQCYKCHETTAWNDIKGVGWYRHH